MNTSIFKIYNDDLSCNKIWLNRARKTNPDTCLIEIWQRSYHLKLKKDHKSCRCICRFRKHWRVSSKNFSYYTFYFNFITRFSIFSKAGYLQFPLTWPDLLQFLLKVDFLRWPSTTGIIGSRGYITLKKRHTQY